MNPCARWSLGFLVIFSLSLFAASTALADEEFTIEATSVAYDQVSKTVSSSGGVSLVFSTASISAETLTYNTQSKELIASQEVSFKREGFLLTGDYLTYNLSSEVGEAGEVLINYQGVYLRGNQITLGPKEIHLNNATFTTCSLANPHYSVKAREIVVFPEVGWVVAYWGYFWINGWPIVPIPTYLYDLKAQEKRKTNLPPFPEFGSNQVDGFFLTEKMVVSADRNSNNALLLNYFSKKGLGIGWDTNYRTNERSGGNARVSYDGVEKESGGITQQIVGKNQTLSLDLGYRERENYERVSRLPSVSLDTYTNPSLSISLANLAEESTGAKYLEGRVEGDVNYPVGLGELGTLGLGAGFDYRNYNDRLFWNLATDSLTLSKDLGAIRTTANYLHFFYNYGQSPFLFEQYHFEPKDQVGLAFSTGPANNLSSVSLQYYLPDMTPKDIDYVFTAKLHCYAIIFGYRVLRQEVNFGFSLVNN